MKKRFNIYKVALNFSPIVYLFLAIFIYPKQFDKFINLSLILLLIQGFNFYKLYLKKTDLANRVFAYLLTTLSSIGLASSTTLILEKIELLKDPNHLTSCSINPVLSCGKIITSSEASVFGPPNPMLGVFGFSILFAVGYSLLTTEIKEKWWWKTLILFEVLGLIFCFWLAHEAIFEIKFLCAYCMVVWVATASLLLLTMRQVFLKKYLSLKSKLWEKIFVNYWWTILLLYLLLHLILILNRFWYYWKTLF